MTTILNLISKNLTIYCYYIYQKRLKNTRICILILDAGVCRFFQEGRKISRHIDHDNCIFHKKMNKFATPTYLCSFLF
jgi:hypothetical protein